MDNNSTTRFSNRVENYVKYRPNYPKEIITYLENKFGLNHSMIIADIGSGTGISGKLFLDNGYTITGVEPNKEMRKKSEELLAMYPDFKTVSGTAENTSLESNSIDVILAGQAFHWFDRNNCKIEFKRILKPKGLVVLIWNERLTDSDFEKEYDLLIKKYAIDYITIDHRNITNQNIQDFFSPHSVELKVFPNQQIFDFDGLKGRLLSSSYMPVEGQRGFDDMIIDLKSLFNKFSQTQKIRIDYDTKVYVSGL